MAAAREPTDGLGRLARSPRLLRLADDERLVALVRAGSGPAFEVIYDRYNRQLLSFCRHMLGRPEEAADAVQHTFLATYRQLAESTRPVELRPWLFTVARNRCLSLLRARRDHVSLEHVEPVTEGLADAVQRRQDLRDLLSDMAQLPEQQRAALVLSEIGALAHSEIAAVLECRPEKVKALVFQARSSLATSRQARDTPCSEVREQLATLTGAALRRGPLRKHLRDCPECRRFRDEVRHQRQAMAVLLPVVPMVGLKHSVLASVANASASPGIGAAGHGGVLAGSATAGAGTAGAGSLAVPSIAVKALAVLALAGGGAAIATGVARHAFSTGAGSARAGAVAPPASQPLPAAPSESPAVGSARHLLAGHRHAVGHGASATRMRHARRAAALAMARLQHRPVRHGAFHPVQPPRRAGGTAQHSHSRPSLPVGPLGTGAAPRPPTSAGSRRSSSALPIATPTLPSLSASQRSPTSRVELPSTPAR